MQPLPKISNGFYIPPEDARRLVGTVPSSRAWKALRKYTLLNEFPYTFTYKELLHRLAKSGNKTDSYRIIRSDLVRDWGWAIYENTSGKIALIGCETDLYRELLTEPSVQKKSVCRRSRRTEGSELQGQDELFPLDEVLAPNPEEEEFPEGRESYKQHRTRERNQKLVKRAKEKRLAERGVLKCDACGFNFYSVYGDLGANYIECHHIKPVSLLQLDERTSLKDIALVCANCHRMLHRKRPWLSLAELESLVRASGA